MHLESFMSTENRTAIVKTCVNMLALILMLIIYIKWQHSFNLD